MDIFFTFSGFLITALLIDEFAKKKEIDIQGFFRRRFYRIVPPLVFMILVVMPFTFLIRKDFVAGIGTQIAAALGFVTNFYEMLSGGSYESQFVPHILIHTWSLALEVHYYVLWGLAGLGLGQGCQVNRPLSRPDCAGFCRSLFGQFYINVLLAL